MTDNKKRHSLLRNLFGNRNKEIDIMTEEQI